MHNLSKKNIIIGNAVTRAAQGFNLAEKRIIFAGIAKLDGKSTEVILTAEEYAKTFNLSLDLAYKQLKDNVENLRKRYISYQIVDEKETIAKAAINWLQGYFYHNKEGYVSFRFSEYIFPYLFELQSHFTKYKLQQACALRSIHSWRLLELFEQQKQINKDGYRWLKISIDDFNHAMEAPESYQKNFKNLRVKIIEPAIKELSEKDNWIIEWKAIKNGRKVVILEFTFSHHPENFL
ncbi:replication initiation protein [Commensalibacter papalotli (ex Botero et al. 2024)]|uniref:Protein involved in initiation of plasmid replication (PDB:2Z9O) n=1 Tax=Commensalibacter papalotli (ex Botero et al. 2024) TaxID=2972766 RepID=A0ABN8WHW7_9PROT|nr:replication initiation protein [Commensalibacter papalotli (ex Botero et al. 2024)]CAI3957407.1 Protein involved in initiation of plasmid replication (PDB:2Z9O) [Commensalibacter papalotli (ex Botero et al. 2024)]CAI3958033.1 Protein involved in initiation of plasmid replication (PDB:2Z9O) [Commensalibacter papalotli (ex Botero et al. 2024)]